ncbi:MAG: GNAT family N-acetyltransferase [candidate division Zixibacteria bacterium]|nr:GNAT family N-acetyltransferase [candidate division Zixibacteria bacterium]
MINIRIMSEADIAFAVELSAHEKWGHLPADLQRLLAFEPNGCFVACDTHEAVGIITSTSYDDWGFLGNLIVKHEKRKDGIGASLMMHAIEYLRTRGVKCIELDGVFPAVPLYRKLGFRDKYLSLRLYRPSSESRGEAISPLPATVDDVVAYDRLRTGLNREKMIRRFFEDFFESVFVASIDRVTRYAIVKPRAGNVVAIGPFVADDCETAESLLVPIIRKYSQNSIAVGLPELNREAVALYRKHGFIYSEPSLRMYLGVRREYEEKIFAIMSPEKG